MDWETSVAIGTTVAGIIFGIWKNLPGALKRRKRRISLDTVERNFQITSRTRMLLQRVRAETGCQRVLCLVARNGGKEWNPEEPLYVTDLDQIVAEGEEDTHSQWNRWEADRAYVRMVHLFRQAGPRGYLLEESQMEDGILKSAYSRQGTVASVVIAFHWIVETNAMVYLSLNFGQRRLPELDADGRPTNALVPLSPADVQRHLIQARNLYNEPAWVRKLHVQAAEVWSKR